MGIDGRTSSRTSRAACFPMLQGLGYILNTVEITRVDEEDIARPRRECRFKLDGNRIKLPRELTADAFPAARALVLLVFATERKLNKFELARTNRKQAGRNEVRLEICHDSASPGCSLAKAFFQAPSRRHSIMTSGLSDAGRVSKTYPILYPLCGAHTNRVVARSASSLSL